MVEVATVTVELTDELKRYVDEVRNDVYAERDKLVQFLTHVYPSYLTEASDAVDGWRYVVVVDLQWNEPTVFGDARNQFGPRYKAQTQQASWHIPDHELSLFSHLEVKPNNWDGHTTEEKYERLKIAGKHFAQSFVKR